jgi:hypothetical protein
MIRVGAFYPGEKPGRLTPEGQDIPGNSLENRRGVDRKRIERPGTWFGDSREEESLEAAEARALQGQKEGSRW